MDGMDELLIQGGNLVLPDEGRVQQRDLFVRETRIAQVGKGFHEGGAEVIDVEGLYVAPGFIDLHVHGGGGADFMDASPEALDTIFANHSRHGTTGLLATLLPAPLEAMQRALHVAAERRVPWLLGVYLEGPFVSRTKKGAFDPQWIIFPNRSALRALLGEKRQAIKIVTFAPEVQGSAMVLQNALKAGAIPAIGHTNATYRQVMTALDSGARHFTHLGNAMTGLHHREPGAVGAALDSDAYVELICDGVHLHPAFVRLVAKVKGFDRICLVTDAISAAGLPDGKYSLGGLPVLVRDGIARLSDGTLAGSTLTMNQAVKNFMEFTGCSLPEAVRCATLNPARLLGIDHRKGSLEVGKDADLVIFDEDFNVHYTILGGDIAYARE